MRELTDHKLAGLNEALRITVEDQPGAGGACHHYRLTGFDSTSNPSDPFAERYGKGADHSTVLFQHGPVQEAGANGISNEALLAIVIDRMRSFQAGPYSCRENACALTKLEEALMWLQKRTRDRLARGVEGTSQRWLDVGFSFPGVFEFLP